MSLRYIIFLLSSLLSFRPSSAFWWYLGEEYAPKDCFDTSKLRLTPSQIEDCSDIRNFRKALKFGLAKGIEQCHKEFSKRRWNCHTNKKNPNLFGNITNKDLKETSFLYAIMSASAVFGMVHACSDGDIYMCGCKEMDNMPEPKDGWSWGGCSDSVENAMIERTMRFADSPHEQIGYRQVQQDRNMIAQHNNRAGYLAVRDNTETVCKCQGLSGSCTVKTCYQRIPSMKQIGSTLMTKYSYATRVLEWIEDNTWILYDPLGIKPKKDDLVYMATTNADSFCSENEAIGSIGTSGRVCSVTSHETDDCTDLCCGRPYYDTTKEVQYDCRCRFIYERLELQCDRCRKTVHEAICT